jgi:hypothetical protein
MKFFQKKCGKLFAITKIMFNFVFQSAFRFKQSYLKSNIYRFKFDKKCHQLKNNYKNFVKYAH